jgi:hypothetical protein
MNPDRRENSHLERLAMVEQRMSHYDESRIAQGEQLQQINVTLTQILVNLERYSQTRENIDAAFEEIRELKKWHDNLRLMVERELPDLRNVRKIVYWVMATLAASAVGVFGLLWKVPI